MPPLTDDVTFQWSPLNNTPDHPRLSSANESKGTYLKGQFNKRHGQIGAMRRDGGKDGLSADRYAIAS